MPRKDSPGRRMTWIDLIIDGLATFRIANMVSSETGPFRMFKKARQSVPRKSSLWEGIRCPFCVGVYAATLVWVAQWHGQAWEIAGIQILALSGLAVVINNGLTRDPS